MCNTFKLKYFFAPTASPGPVFVDMLWGCLKQAKLSLNEVFQCLQPASSRLRFFTHWTSLNSLLEGAGRAPRV